MRLLALDLTRFMLFCIRACICGRRGRLILSDSMRNVVFDVIGECLDMSDNIIKIGFVTTALRVRKMNIELLVVIIVMMEGRG